MDFLNSAIAAVQIGVNKLLDMQKHQLLLYPSRIIEKSPHDYQTEFDISIERAIGDKILEIFPDHCLIGEEFFTSSPASKYRWFIDPIDGTRNLIQGRQDYAVSLALYEEDTPILGIIALPARESEIIAEQSIPYVMLNGQPIHKAMVPENLSKSLVGIPGNIYTKENADKLLHAINKLIYRVEGFRASGALGYDLALMSLGEISARLSYKTKPVDVAAGAYILQKIGGVVTDIVGNTWSPFSDSILASISQPIHEELLQALNS